MITTLLLIGALLEPQTAYHIIDTQRTSTMEKELSGAAAQGFRLLLASNTRATAKVLILERLPQAGAGRFEYVLLADSKIADLEQQMNGAASKGFRLVARSAIRNPSVAQIRGEEVIVVMEKGPASPTRFQYQVAGFMAEYEERDLLLKKDISSGELDTLAIDVRLAEAVREGFDVAAIVTRKVQKKESEGIAGLAGLGGFGARRKIKQEVIVIFEKAADSGTPGARVPAMEAAKRYHVMTASGSDEQFENMLNRGAAAGYHVVAVSSVAFPEMVAILERNPSADISYSYRVLASAKTNTLELEFANLTAGGWLPHPRGMMDMARTDGVAELAILSEKIRGSKADEHEYRILSAARMSSIEKDLAAASAQGFEVVTAGPDIGALTVILKRKKDREEQ